MSRRDCAPPGPRSRWAQVSDPDPVCRRPDPPLPCSSSIHFLRREEKKKKSISQTVAQGTPGSNEALAAAGGTCPNTPQGAPDWGEAGAEEGGQLTYDTGHRQERVLAEEINLKNTVSVPV